MRIHFTFVIAVVLLIPRVSAAQTGSAGSGGYIDFNLGIAGSRAKAQTFTFPVVVVDEPASKKSSTYSRPSSGTIIDFGAGYMFTPRVGAGFSVVRVSHEDPVRLEAVIPHPTFPNAFGHDSAISDPLKRTETAFSMNAMFVVHQSRKVKIRAFAGPSFITYKAVMVDDILYDQTTFTITDFVGLEAKETTMGFNVGADVNYFFTHKVGVGGGVRLTTGTVTLPIEPMSEVSQRIAVGGPQAFFGVGLKFGKR